MPTYTTIAASWGAAIERLARGYELDPALRQELVQEIHVELFRSLKQWDGRCSERTWVYRVAHNIGVSHVRRQRRVPPTLTLDEQPAQTRAPDQILADRRGLDRALALIHALPPLDRQIVLSWLDGLEVAEIAEIVGRSAANISTRLYRAKALLSQRMEAP